MSAITLFEEKLVRCAWNAAEEKWYFSVDDVVEILTGSVNARDYIKKLRKRDPELHSYWGTNCPLVEMTAADGKNRKIRAAHTEVTSKAGGTIAGNARRALEIESGTKISTSRNFNALPESQAKKLPKHPQP